MELKLKHLAPYLPYKLRIQTLDGIKEVKGIDSAPETVVGVRYYHNQLAKIAFSIDIKPILRPLSDLRNETECKQLVNFVKYGNYKNLPVWLFEDLIKQHFDVFGLIDNGLAIDINQTNPDPSH